MQNISGFGSNVTLVASVSYPLGFNITKAADDADFVDLPVLTIADAAKGLNGDLITFSKANPIDLTLNVIPQSEDDINLGIILQANAPVLGRALVKDIITLNIVYPNGSYAQLLNGVMISGIPGNSIASAGRLKTKPYAFKFESIIWSF